MIILLHGDHTVASRVKLMSLVEEAKKAGKDVRQLDGKTLDALALTQALESSSLFGGSVVVLIEGLLTKLGKKAGLPAGREKQATALTDILKRSSEPVDIILWEDKEIGKTLMGLLGAKVSAQLFKTPVVIWELLDGIRPGSGAVSIGRLQQALERDAAELIFTLFVRRIRHLIMLRDGVIPDGLQGWQAGRLTSQAKSFRMDRLLSMEKKLLEIDVSTKTGTSPFPLAQQLELFFVDL